MRGGKCSNTTVIALTPFTPISQGLTTCGQSMASYHAMLPSSPPIPWWRTQERYVTARWKFPSGSSGGNGGIIRHKLPDGHSTSQVTDGSDI